MKVLLNSVPVEAPVGLDGLTLKKSRNSRYWGYLYRKLGYVPGLNEITFTDPYAVRTLRDAFARHRLMAETSFELVDFEGRSLYESFVDYARFGFRPGEVSCSFRDEQSVSELEVSLSTLFSITPAQLIHLPGQPLTSEATYILKSNPVVSRSTSGPMLHSLPIVRKDEKNQAVPGELFSVAQPLNLNPIYRNNTGRKQTLKLSGVVDVTMTTSGSITGNLGYRIMNGNQIVSTTTLSSFALGAEDRIVSILDTLVTVAAGHSLVIGWVDASGTVSTMTASYNLGTAIALQLPVTVPETDCYGLYAFELFQQLLNRIGGSFSFQSDFFKTGSGRGAFITNGACLRGIVKPLQLSFDRLFDGLNNLFNLMMDLKGSTLSLESKEDLLKKGGTTILTTINDARYTVNTAYLVSEVYVGYQTWKGESLTSAAETNAARSFRTAITTYRNPLDLRSTLIGAGTLIEETRQKQFNPETSGSEKAEVHDDDLFIVMVDANGRARATPFYNAEIDPAICLIRWVNLLTHNNVLTLETYEGAIATGEDEPLPLDDIDPLIGDLTAVVEVPMSMPDYEGLQDWIEWFDGEKNRRGLLMDAEWNHTANGTIATLTIAC